MKKLFLILIIIFLLISAPILYFQFFKNPKKNQKVIEIEKEPKINVVESIPLEKPPFIK